MDRQDDDPNTMVNSSIALLQERFRKLEKVKERREGKKLLKLFSADHQSQRSASSSNKMQFQPSESSSRRPSLHDSLSLGLNLTGKQADHRRNAPPESNLWPQHGAAATASAARNFDNSDVDTSLHL